MPKKTKERDLGGRPQVPDDLKQKPRSIALTDTVYNHFVQKYGGLKEFVMATYINDMNKKIKPKK